MTGRPEPAPTEPWWADGAFWDEMFEFVFPPEMIAAGEDVAARAAAVLGLPRGASVLDLGCGFGRVSLPLARLGLRVTGVDAHRGFVDHGREWARRERLDVDLREGDFSCASFDAPFDAAVCLFNSFGYFADPAQDRRVLDAAFAALRPGGRFLLECAHRDGVVRTMHVREREGGGRRWREEPRFDLVSGLLETRWSVTRAGETRTFTSRSRPYSATELGAMLRAAGFDPVRFMSGFDGAPPSLDGYMIVALCERPGR